MNDEALKKYFDFDEADLYANRNGVLTTRQQTRITRNSQFFVNLMRILGSILILIAIIPTLFIWLGGAQRSFLIVWLLTWVPAWTLFGILALRLAARDKQFSQKLLRVEGPVNIVKEKTYNATSKMYTTDYELHLGGETFDVESSLADIMLQGDTYTLYYLKDTKEIMSAEFISKAA